MTPSRWQAMAAGAILLAALAWKLWPRGPEAVDAPAAESSREPRPVAPVPAPLAPGGAGFAGSALREAVVQSGAPGSTPALQQPASPADGFVEVRVLAQGKPRLGAHVRLYFKGRADPNTAQVDWRFAGAADSGPGGIARIAARPGVYLLAARSETFAPARLEFQRPAGEATTRVSVELQPGLVVSGRTVQSGTQEAVPLALVVLTWEGSRRASAPGEEQARATSDARGKFRIEGLAKGPYRATAQAAGYARGAARIDAQASREMVIELAAASFIEGQVVLADGSPAAGAEVSASGGEEAVTATASETGTFSLEVSPRSWSLTARRGDEAGRAPAPVVVAAGATARGVKIQLGAASGISGTTVASATHQPVVGAQVAVSPYNQSGDSGRAVSDGSGHFAVKGLAPGSYDVEVSADGFTDQSRRGVTVQPGQQFPLRVELRRTGALEGLVRDSAGRPVPYALVRSMHAGFGGPAAPPVEARSDDTGAYRLAGLAPGAGSFTALRDGSAQGAVASAEVPEGGAARLDFQLQDEGVVTGRVRRKDGSPPPAEASVRAVPAAPRLQHSYDSTGGIPIDAAGNYLASLPAGAYSLFVQGSASGFGGRTFVTVEAGKTSVQDLTWIEAEEEAQGFGGAVLEPGGTPSPGAWVRAKGANFVFMTFADDQGRFHLDKPRTDLPDSIELVALNGGRSGKATVPPRQTEISIQLQPAATLRGHLAGGAVDSFRVEVAPAGAGHGRPGGEQSLEFSGDRFELGEVPALRLNLSVVTRDGRSAALEVTLAPGEIRDLEVALEPLAQVRGRLVDAATHAPLPGVPISLDHGEEAVTAADGRFSLPAPAGAHALHAYLPRYRPLRKDFTAQPGEQLDLGEVALKPLAAQSGTVGMQLRGDSETPVTVVFLIPDGPAEKAGVQLGDQIAAVDGKPVAGVADASARIQGAPGAPVQLSLRRSGTALSVTVVRAP